MKLRPYEAGDRAFFVALFGDAEVCAHTGGALEPEAAGRLFDSLLDGSHLRAIAAFAVVESGVVVGHAALFREQPPGDVEIGFMVVRSRWGAGLGTAIAAALVDEARRLGFSRVIGTVDLENLASRRVLEKLGATGAVARDEDGAYMRFTLPLAMPL